MLEDFRRMAVRKKIVGLEILIEFREMEIAPRLLARSRRPGLAVANDAMFRGDPAGVNERPQREDNAGGVAAGIGDKPRARDFVSVQLGQTVNPQPGHGQPLTSCFSLLSPA